MNSEFESVFARLRGILQKHSDSLKVSHDRPDHYCLDVTFSPKLKKPFPIAWVKISKGYVGYHFMPVYMFPKLRDGMSKALRARMQGKSCFNFKAIDEALFKELEQVTADGLAMSRKAGFAPEQDDSLKASPTAEATKIPNRAKQTGTGLAVAGPEELRRA